MNEEAPRISPRLEARVLPPEELTPGQREAALRVQGLINEMAGEAWPRREPSSGLEKLLPRIDEQRQARIVLIDGNRGSGKTSVLLTVLEFWRRTLLEQPVNQFKGWAKPEQPVVPVGLLEMQPLPPSTKLLVYIASALFQVVDAIEESRQAVVEERRTPPWHPFQLEELGSRQQWRRFFAAAARGWEGSVEQRGALDAEAYALELEHAERQRLDVISAFRWFMDDLVSDFKQWQGLATRVPLFVVSLDDADLNPRSAVELLDLLRALYHPRLAFVLTGSSDLFVTMLRLQGLGAYLEPLRGIQLMDEAHSEIETQAEWMAWRTYDKLVPDRHRCEIPLLVPEYRYGRVRDVFDRVPVVTTEDPPGLSGDIRYYFDRIPQLAAALPASMRGLVDLREYVLIESAPMLDGLLPTRHIAQKLVKRLWDEAVRAAQLLTTDKLRLETVVRIDDRGNMVVDSSNVRWRPVRSTRARIPIDDHRVLESTVLEPLRAVLKHDDADGPLLSEGAVAAFMLANVVALDGQSDTFVRTLSTRQGFDTAYVFVDYGTTHLGTLRFGWPLPDGALLFDILLFGKRWAEGIDGQQRDVELLGVFFLELALGIEKRDLRVDLLDRDALSEKPQALGEKWADLAKRLVRLGQQSHASTRKWLLSQWAREKAGLLATPECGLPDAAADVFLRALEEACDARDAEEGKTTRTWRAWCGALTQARRRRARFALEFAERENVKEEELLGAIDAEHAQHAWQRVEQLGRPNAPLGGPGLPTTSVAAGGQPLTTPAPE